MFGVSSLRDRGNDLEALRKAEVCNLEAGSFEVRAREEEIAGLEVSVQPVEKPHLL
jgi:hypothetical protein